MYPLSPYNRSPGTSRLKRPVFRTSVRSWTLPHTPPATQTIWPSEIRTATSYLIQCIPCLGLNHGFCNSHWDGTWRGQTVPSSTAKAFPWYFLPDKRSSQCICKFSKLRNLIRKENLLVIYLPHLSQPKVLEFLLPGWYDSAVHYISIPCKQSLRCCST